MTRKIALTFVTAGALVALSACNGSTGNNGSAGNAPSVDNEAEAEATEFQDIVDNGTIQVVTSASSAPHGYYDSGYAGIMVEVAERIADDFGVDIELTNVQFSGLIPAITTGRADIMAAPMFITEERAEQVDFSDPIYGWSDGVVVPPGSDFTPQDLDDLQGSTVGVLQASVQYESLEAVGDVEVNTYPDYPSLMLDVSAGRIDAGLVDPPSLAYRLDQEADLNMEFVEEFEAGSMFYVAIAATQGSTALIDEVNRVLAEMKDDGSLEEIMNDWGVDDQVDIPES